MNSNNQALVGEAFTIPAGTSKTVTIAGNMSSSLSNYAGQVASIAVVGVNTSGTVSGSLPITGAAHTINSSLSIGSVTAERGTLDPASAQTKEVGTDGYTFTSVKVTAGSVEKVRLNSIRFNQSGSASSNDLANVMVYVDGVAYTPTVSSDGKYYTANFGSGIVIDKGLFKEISVKGDVVSGSGRTIAFDIYKITDINVTGELYGYGITPPTSGNGFTPTSPVYDASVVTISGGSITVSKANSVAAQNVAINVPNQPLGGFTVKVDGEPVSVQSLVFNATATGDEVANVTQISIVDSNGAVVAGPVDGVNTTAPYGTVTFTDTITFPVGENTYTLKGKLGSTFVSDDTFAASTTPSTQWTSVTGQQTGNTITPDPSSAITLNTMTAKAAAATISVSADPVDQNVVAGTQDFTLANVRVDATASGEDLKFISFKISLAGTNTPTQLTGCKLYNGSTALNTGSNIPTMAAGSNTITLDGGGVTVPKGVVSTLTFKCNLSGSATAGNTFQLGIPAASTLSATGVTSGSTATLSGSAATGQTMTVVSSGSFTVEKSDSSPSYDIVAAGTTGNVVGVLKLRATNEDITLNKLALQMSNSSASSTPANITKVTLHKADGTQVGEAVFAGTRYATSTVSGLTLNRDVETLLTIKVDLKDIGTTGAGTQGALVQIDYDGNDSTGTQGTGATTINTGSSSDTAVDGIRVFKSYPTVERISDGIAENLRNGDQPLLRFKVTANSKGNIGLDSFSFRLSTTTATVSSINAFAYETLGPDGQLNDPVSGVNASGKLDDTNAVWVDGSTDIQIDIDSNGTDTALQIPAGETRYFEIRGDVSGAATGASIQTTLRGDAAYPSLATLMGNATAVNADTNNNFVWSPNATTTSVQASNDWTNGYRVYSANGLNGQTINY
ncbi:MAG: hypothetical protein COV70_00785 [Parcubacteria group bacterium CG11_big_fil_rev_8_21_14_0_20_39_22]|nr:MAG: hypothetical protein COV70_00785 [Parcubacteria group bacterium CG11_big_fil_rev_8_21_14_0_20_39_22]